MEKELDQKRSLLIIDDNADVLNSIEAGLVTQGYLCQTATSAQSALELINGTSFDLMITDIVLPGMDGFELTERSKKLRPDMPVIIMTGFTEDFSYERAIEVGASDFIKKPFALHELIMRIRLVKLQEKLLKMSVTDELTGLYNRRGFFALIEQQLKLSNRQKNVLYLLYADLDNLKAINDTYGHEAGDQVLIETAKILIDTFRDSDIIARIGGDEFIIVPVGTTEDETTIATARLHQNVVLYNAEKKGPYALSISVGIAKFDSNSPCSVDELIRQADKSMYAQKMLKKQRDS
jgi:two-component system, cell cycle response regulator